MLVVDEELEVVVEDFDTDDVLETLVAEDELVETLVDELLVAM